MTKLQTLNLFLTERFMTALNEVLEKVGGAVLESEQEVQRLQSENQFLKGRLEELEKILHNAGPGVLFSPNTAEVALPQQQRRSQPRHITEPRDLSTNHNQNQLHREQPANLKPEVFSHPSCPEPQLENLSGATTGATHCLTSANGDQEIDFAIINEIPTIKTEPTESTEQQASDVDATHSPLLQIVHLESASISGCNTPDSSPFLNRDTAYSIPHPEAPLEPLSHNGPYFASQKSVNMMTTSHNVLQTLNQHEVIPNVNHNSSSRTADPRSVQITTYGGPVSVSVPPVHKRPFKLGQGIAKAQGSLPCPQCGRLFLYHSQLKVHMYIHTGEKPYVCKQCGKRFNNGGTLRNHSSVHRQVRMYSCPVCSRRFKNAHTCRKHMRVHTKVTHTDVGAQQEMNVGFSRVTAAKHHC